jgi:thioesterase DpgC
LACYVLRAMTENPPAESLLAAAGLPAGEARAWLRARPEGTTSLESDAARYGRFWALGAALLGRLPAKPARNDAERTAAAALIDLGRKARSDFLRSHATTVYAALTGDRSRFVRLEELCATAAEAFPGLVPSRAELAREATLVQRDKDGCEVDQGIFLAHALADERAGRHLCHAMLLPRAESAARLAELEARGALDLPGARLVRRGRALELSMRNPEVLNAEDATTLEGFESAIDVALLDPASEVCVLRGDPVAHPRYGGARVFGAGINLTHLYHGRIPFLWFLVRDMGAVNKLYRGLARPDIDPEHPAAEPIEKLWIAAVERFAIGGHCQLLLVMDQVIAERDAYMTLPARKEGIIPGAANLRLARFVGARAARQAVLADRRTDFDSPEGRLVCDELVEPGGMERALDARVAALTGSGMVSAAGNRRAFRIGEEPLDAFRRYMATYAWEQASCHFSPTLIANLEKHWNAAARRLHS